jgi:hypothetical protein
MPRVPACWGRCLTAREANVADSMHDACRPLAAHNVYSALTAVVCRPDLVSLRSAAQTARHRVTVRDRVDIRGILLVGGDIGRIIIAAEPRRGWIAVRRRIVAIVPKRIIAAVPRRVAPHHHRRAPMLETGQGCRTDARERHDLSRRRNRNGAGAAARSQPGSLERYLRARHGRQKRRRPWRAPQRARRTLQKGRGCWPQFEWSSHSFYLRSQRTPTLFRLIRRSQGASCSESLVSIFAP